VVCTKPYLQGGPRGATVRGHLLKLQKHRAGILCGRSERGSRVGKSSGHDWCVTEQFGGRNFSGLRGFTRGAGNGGVSAGTHVSDREYKTADAEVEGREAAGRGTYLQLYHREVAPLRVSGHRRN